MSFKFLSLSALLVLVVIVTGCDQPKAAKKMQDKSAAGAKKAVAEMTEEETKKAVEVTDAGSKTKPADSGSATKPKEGSGKKEMEGMSCELASGALKLMAPAAWESVTPKSSMTAYQFKVPKVEGEDAETPDGKLTVMTVGGSMDANLQRWYGQFTQPDGSSTEDATKIEDINVAGFDVKLVSLQGTMSERMGGGPFAGGKMVERPNYRKMIAVIQSGEMGQHFVTLTGPGKTVQANSEHFMTMVKSLTKSE